VIGLSVTGIAGPEGGMPGKPVGLVWIGLSTVDGDWAWKFIWDGDRLGNKMNSARKALDILQGIWLESCSPKLNLEGLRVFKHFSAGKMRIGSYGSPKETHPYSDGGCRVRPPQRSDCARRSPHIRHGK